MTDHPSAGGPDLGKPAVRGFLPIHTNAFDRVFIAVVAFIALHLFWMRFLESEVSLYGATATSIILGWWIIARG